ncbi:MAG: 3 beta-hydroxysteroid dehydrogenase/Delta 5--_4-isomerase [Lentisphaerae bacterium ADurb.Bin242]|nr:MAG: 3 beta-hydroxysteroid dehydrogenase/Delta 5-->4-isomerase [Lentisphaerae bacterium ADurb.Bin242]
MKILITGAGGYIGSNAAEFFMKRGFDVTGTVHRKTSERFLRSGAKAVEAELCDSASRERLFAEKFDFVIHIAARASDVGRDERFRIANFEAVKHLADLSMHNGVKRFVYLSTSDVYGLHDFHGESEEELAFDHSVRNPYPKYKILSEEWLAAHLPPERFSCVRPCVVWGSGDTTITPRAVAYLLSSPFVIHFGKWKGRNRWPLAHVENVCRTLYAAMILPEAGGKGVTVLDSRRTTLSQFYRDLARQFLPGKMIREICLPVWTVRPAAWFSSSFSTWLNRDSPLFDPSLYALDTIVHNLDFSNARMLDWLKQSGESEVSFTGGGTPC